MFLALVLLVAIADIIKFNILGNDVIIIDESLNNEQPRATQETETQQEPETQGIADLETLIAHSWKWIATFDAENKYVEAKEPEKFILTFDANGQFASTTDCNNVSATYTTSESAISFGPIMMTKMTCSNSSQEDIYVEMLGKINEYAIDQNTLMITLNNKRLMIFQS